MRRFAKRNCLRRRKFLLSQMLPRGCKFGLKKTMICKTYAAAAIGLNVVTVTVETDISAGVGLYIVGMPDIAVKESLMRITTALRCNGYSLPGKRIVINLAPADIRKEGSSFDLAIAVALLCAMEVVPAERAGEYIIMGELALDGTVRNINATLPIADTSLERGFKKFIFPHDSAMEAVDINGAVIYGVHRLQEVIAILSDEPQADNLVLRRAAAQAPERHKGPDFKDVKGQQEARRGLEIAAAGAHNIILIGSPGCGKTLMAGCLASILPQMTKEESVQTSKIYSVAGKSIGRSGLLRERPFRAPHNSASKVALLGGGSDAMPGEISLAHNGVLYLDEVNLFSRATLDLLRQPLEDGKVVISRARYRVEYPCKFMFVASMNPCPCGYYGDESGKCRCSQNEISHFMTRVSGPMMDRIDMHIYVKRVPAEVLVSDAQAESSAVIAGRVARARQIQIERFAGEGIFTNSAMSAELIAKHCSLTAEQSSFLNKIIDKLNLSARAYSRILKLSRTIADLAGEERITRECIAEAIRYRNLDRF